MTESSAMLEIRKIRDENSRIHLSQSNEERSREFSDSVEWFKNEIKKRRQSKEASQSKVAIS